MKITDKRELQQIVSNQLDRQTAKNSALLSGNFSKYEFLTGKDVLPEKYLLDKATTMKRFEYHPLGKELKVKTDIAEEQYQTSDNTFDFDKIIEKEKQHLKTIVNQI